jgi:hypothetical protein
VVRWENFSIFDMQFSRRLFLDGPSAVSCGTLAVILKKQTDGQIMKTLTEIKFDKIVKEGFHEILKPLGFKKKANNFYIQRQDLGQIINIQKSTWYSRDHNKFTINTGLFLPEYWTGLAHHEGKELPTFPTELDCLIRKRIGELRNQHDTWYGVDESTDESELIIEMRSNLKDYILPFFDRTKTKEAFLELLDTEILYLAPLGKLVAYGELKQFDRARKEYNSILKEKTNPYFLETLKEYGQKYGIV